MDAGEKAVTSFDHHAELESYNDSMRERDLACEFCGSTDPAESQDHCAACAHTVAEAPASLSHPVPSNSPDPVAGTTEGGGRG